MLLLIDMFFKKRVPILTVPVFLFIILAMKDTFNLHGTGFCYILNNELVAIKLITTIKIKITKYSLRIIAESIKFALKKFFLLIFTSLPKAQINMRTMLANGIIMSNIVINQSLTDIGSEFLS